MATYTLGEPDPGSAQDGRTLSEMWSPEKDVPKKFFIKMGSGGPLPNDFKPI